MSHVVGVVLALGSGPEHVRLEMLQVVVLLAISALEIISTPERDTMIVL